MVAAWKKSSGNRESKISQYVSLSLPIPETGPFWRWQLMG
jgi:hypothetical protein